MTISDAAMIAIADGNERLNIALANAERTIASRERQIAALQDENGRLRDKLAAASELSAVQARVLELENHVDAIAQQVTILNLNSGLAP